MFERVVALLVREASPIFAIVDGARDRSIPLMLRNSCLQYRSLYDGKSAEEFGSFGPYLVSMPEELADVEQWVSALWGKNWGVFLSCSQPFDSVRRHLRRFLIVEFENGRRAHFRFYDPRVLRTFLPNCTHEEWIQFFGPIGTYFAESEDAKSVLRFWRDADEPEPERLALVH